MNTVSHQIVLSSDEHFGNRLPPRHVGLLMAELPLIVKLCILMSLRNRSTASGRAPEWLNRAADIRYVGHQGDDQIELLFEAPSLGDSACEIYEQKELFDELSKRPSARDTGFDLLGDVLCDVKSRNTDSNHFDSPLLTRLTRFGKVFEKSPFRDLILTSRRHTKRKPACLSPSIIDSAKSLLGKTPASQRVRLVGQLDSIEASTQRFSLLLDTGEKVFGVFSDDQLDSINELWRQRVLVLGMAVYRPSGKLLRVDADEVTLTEETGQFFSAIPQPRRERFDLRETIRNQQHKKGLAAIMGKWPGDESDDEIAIALKELS